MRNFRTSTKLASILFAGAVAIVGPVSTSLATTIPFTSASVYGYIPADPNDTSPVVTDVNSAPASPANATYSNSGAWGNVSALSDANLQTGQLKSQAINNNFNSFPYIQSNATFGDGFRTLGTNGSPFTWQSDSVAEFTMNLNGTLTSSYPLNESNTGAFVMLSILKHDTLTPDAFTDVNYDITTDPNVIGYFVYLLGNTSFGLYFNGKPLDTTQAFTSIPSEINQTFTPGEDFDWWLLLGSAGQLVDPNTSFNFDLAHTLTLGYTGPTGTTTESTSGLFENFQPTESVPEPVTLALLGIGLAGLSFSRRRIANSTTAAKT